MTCKQVNIFLCGFLAVMRHVINDAISWQKDEYHCNVVIDVWSLIPCAFIILGDNTN